MKDFLVKQNIWILTAAAIGVAVYILACWPHVPLEQKLAGAFIVGITLHEWEETRFPGGFYNLMGKKFGLMDAEGFNAHGLGRAHGSVCIAIFFFAFVPFFLWRIEWLLAVPCFLGIFEAFIHVVGIKLHHMPHPYTPGMVTAVACMLPISIWLLIEIAPHIQWWGWLCAALYYIACFALMEILVLRSIGVSPQDVPQIIQRVRAGSAK